MYSTAPAADLATGHSLVGGGSYPSAEVQSVYSTAPAADLATGHSLVAGGSYPSAEVQSVYSTAPAADLATGHSLVAGGLIPLPRCSRCILQPQQPTWPQDTRWWEGVLSLCRGAVGVFYSPSSRLGHRTLVGGRGSYPFAEVQSVYSTAPAADLATGHSLVAGGSYPSAEVQSVYSTAPAADLATGHSLVGVGLIPLPRCSRCILQPQQPTWPQDTRWWEGGLIPLPRCSRCIL